MERLNLYKLVFVFLKRKQRKGIEYKDFKGENKNKFTEEEDSQ